jgi:RNA recognition motif-containing protein
MNHKLYVRNLPYSAREDALWKLFSQSGTVVSVDLIKDRLSRQSKGYAFIVMSNVLDAEKAIEMFNGRRLDGNEIRVSFARRREGLIADDNQSHPAPKWVGRNVSSKRSVK